jgi:hypothetical protein
MAALPRRENKRVRHRWLAVPLLAAALAIPGVAACQASAAAPLTATAIAPLDRAGLVHLANVAVQALLANDASRLPLADDFRYTENGQALDIGDGLWGTLSAYAGQDPALVPAAADLHYRADIVDPAAGEIVAYRGIDENGTKGVLALRIKAAAGKITEMEAIAFRHEYVGPRSGTVTLFQPRLLQPFEPASLGSLEPLLGGNAPAERDRLIAAANAYFDGQVAGRSARVPIDPGCVRRDNGHLSTGAADSQPLDPKVPAFKPWALGCAAQIDSGLYGYVEAVRERRFVVDAERGLVAAFDVWDVPGTKPSFKVKGVGTVAYPGPRAGAGKTEAQQQFTATGGANLFFPSSALATHLFKIEGGRIVRIEALARGTPYGFLSGWSAPSR